MSKSIGVMGKGGVGNTFMATHLAMAFGELQIKTLLVGCDQKKDTHRALSPAVIPSLMETLEKTAFQYQNLPLSDLVLPITDYVDVVELGPSQLMVGHYAEVLEEAFHVFDHHDLLARYDMVVFDINDERFDAVHNLLFRKIDWAIGVSDDSPESLFVVNRLLRATLIASYEYSLPIKLLGLVNNRSLGGGAFNTFVEKTRCLPLLSIEESESLAALRPHHRTIFRMDPMPGKIQIMVAGILRIADLLRGNPLNLNPITPMEDDDIWALQPPVSLSN